VHAARRPPHLPQAQGAGSMIRSTGRLSGSLRGWPLLPRERFSCLAQCRPNADQIRIAKGKNALTNFCQRI
jgi:hypothetical protein